MTWSRHLAALVPLTLLAACNSGGPAAGVPGNSEDHRPYAGIAAGETVHFVGTEPFWGGDVAGAMLTYTTPDDPAGARVAVERFAGRGGVSWTGTFNDQPFALMVTPGTCSDGMSDRSFPFVATLQVAGEQRQGCAWTDRQRYTGAPGESTASAAASASPAAVPTRLAAQELVRAEWRKADNRATCAPVSFARLGVDGAPRAANFAGGWGVAWDQVGLRSAFGVAGVGRLDSDALPPDEQRARLARQWPYATELAALPAPAFAGYGLEGAGRYRPDNPEGHGENSLAYVRIAGQSCDYNVWSRLGRAHLESLLQNLRLLP